MNIQKILEAAAEERASKEKKRNYLGCSEIGRCARELWLKYYGHYTPTFPGNVLRIFAVGKVREDMFVEELRKAGIIVNDSQRRFEWFDGKFSGHWDGEICGKVFEFKTMNKKSFDTVSKNGVELFSETYFAQVQLYMHGSGLKEALFIAEHKDTGNIYEEIIQYRKSEAEKYLDKAKLIIYSKHPPKGISPSPDWYICRWCGANTETLCRRTWPGENTYDF